MTTTDKLTDEALVHRAVLDWIKEDAPIGIKMQMTPDLANKLSARIAHRRASQAQPTGTELLPCPFCGDNHATTTYTRDGRLVVCTSCGAKSGNYYHGPKDMPSADERAIAAWNRRASRAALVSVGKASGMVEARVSLAARQIRQTLRDYGHRCAETSLPDLIAADVDAALRKQDEIHAPATSDGLREALETIRDGYGPNHLSKFALAIASAALSSPSKDGDDK